MRCFKDEELLNVEWKNDDGTIIEKDIDLDFGIMPEYNGPTPTKAPDRNYTYTFSGWNKAIGPLKRNMVFRATYTPHERIGYLVTFSGTDLENTFVTEGEKVEKPEDPTKIDSIFKGWYADAEYSQTFDFSSPITKDTVIYAKWEKKKYTITRKNADGTVLETDTNVPYGSNPQYNGQTPSKTKDQQYTYTFSGRSPTITEVTANQTYTATFKTTTNQYSITFKDENGTVLKSATQYPYGTMIDTINIPTPPTKRGFTFMGRNPVLGTVTQDRTYTAVYQIQNYTITYKVDGKIYATEQHTYGENITLKPEPTKEGYTFSHWNRNLPATMPDEDITIEGTFTPITYHITYQLNSGTNHIDNPDTYTIETPTFPLKSPMREGYSFKGRKEGNQILTQIVKGTKGDKNLTATREANKVHIILDEQGGTGGTSDFWYYFGTQKYYQDEACTQELQKIVKPTKAGYTFQDYFSETIGERFGVYRKDGQRIELDTPEEDTYYRISSEHTLKARREANTIKISLDKNGGTGGTDALRYRYDTPIFYRDEAMTQRISKIIRPTRKGYLFQDYYSEEKGERYLAYEGTDGTIVEIADDLHTDISTNHTLKARRNPKIIHITLDKQGGTGGTSDFYFSFDTKKYYTDENLTQELKKIVKPTKEGYTFQDYFSEEIGERFVAYQNGNKRIELDTPEEDTYYKIANDLTLKARRKEKENEKPQPTHSS
ncbi:InlB B-repeat-containing protein [bacterium]|nr:InlB B-repeat-containing protein [bacterium]